MQRLVLRGPLAPAMPKHTAPRPFFSSAGNVSGMRRSMHSRIVPRAAIKDVAGAAADASGLTVKEAEAAVRAAFDFIAAEVRNEQGRLGAHRSIRCLFFHTSTSSVVDVSVFATLSADLPLSFLSRERIEKRNNLATLMQKKTKKLKKNFRQVAKGEKVTVAGFGTFERRERPARAGRNPRTGEPLAIAAKSAPAFVAAKALKDQVDAGNKN